MTNDVNSVSYNILNDELISVYSTVKIVLSGRESSKESDTIKILKQDDNDVTFFATNPQNDDLNVKSEFFTSLIKSFSDRFSKVIELKDKSDTKWFNNELRELKNVNTNLYKKALITDLVHV